MRQGEAVTRRALGATPTTIPLTGQLDGVLYQALGGVQLQLEREAPEAPPLTTVQEEHRIVGVACRRALQMILRRALEEF